MAKLSDAQARASMLNRLAGTNRFKAVETNIPGTNVGYGDRFSIVDTKTGNTYDLDSIYGQASLASIERQLRKDSASSTSKKIQRKTSIRHAENAFSEDTLLADIEHYGVLGMKWGVRRDRERATARATKKLTKLDSKVRSAEQGTQKAQEKSLKRRQKADSAILFKKRKARKAARSIDAVNRAHVRAQRATLKAKKWFDSMADVLGKETVQSLSKNYGDVGKRYADMRIDDIMKNVGTDIDMRKLAFYYDERSKKR